MDWKWAILYTALTSVTVMFTWRFPCRRIAIAMLLNVLLTNIAGYLVLIYAGDANAAAATPAINVTGEVLIVAAAAVSLLDCTRSALIVLLLSLTSCLISLAYSLRADAQILLAYEELNNAILIVQCVILLPMGLWCVVGDSAARFWRWRGYRRRAVDAGRRMGMAPRR